MAEDSPQKKLETLQKASADADKLRDTAEREYYRLLREADEASRKYCDFYQTCLINIINTKQTAIEELKKSEAKRVDNVATTPVAAVAAVAPALAAPAEASAVPAVAPTPVAKSD